MHRRTFLRASGLVAVTAGLPPGLDPPPFLNLDDPRDLDATAAEVERLRTARFADGKARHHDALVGLSERLTATLDRTPTSHDLYRPLAWSAFQATYLVGHGALDQMQWWHARNWFTRASDLAARAGDADMRLLARCGAIAARGFAGLGFAAMNDLRDIGWTPATRNRPTVRSVTLAVEGFTALAPVASGVEVRRVVERAIKTAAKLPAPGRGWARPHDENVAAWGGFALAEVDDRTELAEAERLLAMNLRHNLDTGNRMGAAETRSMLALVYARRGNMGDAIDHAAVAYADALALDSQRSRYRVIQAAELLDDGKHKGALVARIRNRNPRHGPA